MDVAVGVFFSYLDAASLCQDNFVHQTHQLNSSRMLGMVFAKKLLLQSEQMELSTWGQVTGEAGGILGM